MMRDKDFPSGDLRYGGKEKAAQESGEKEVM